jgi:hypothetical protein
MGSALSAPDEMEILKVIRTEYDDLDIEKMSEEQKAAIFDDLLVRYQGLVKTKMDELEREDALKNL